VLSRTGRAIGPTSRIRVQQAYGEGYLALISGI
jgi:hypothetical protein